MSITFLKNHDGSHHTGLSKKQWRSLWRRNFNSFWCSPFWWSHNNLFVNSRCRVMVCIPPSLYQIFYHIFLNLSQCFSTYKGVKILKYDKTFQIDYLSPFLTSGGTVVKFPLILRIILLSKKVYISWPTIIYFYCRVKVIHYLHWQTRCLDS